MIAGGLSHYQDRTLRDLDLTRVECDEIWAFCYSKQKNVPEDFRDTFGYGDVWTWTAIDAETKLVPSWLVGERTMEDRYEFMHDLRSRILVGKRIQLTTDGLAVYPPVLDALWRNAIDYTVVVKEYGGADEHHRYSPADCTGMEKRVIAGRPDKKKANTSYVERNN